MKSAVIAAIVAAVVAAGSAGAALHYRSHVIRVVGATVSIPANSTGFSWAGCPARMKAVSGGIAEDPFTATPVKTEASYPLPSLGTWETVVDNPNATPVSVQTVAVCLG